MIIDNDDDKKKNDETVSDESVDETLSNDVPSDTDEVTALKLQLDEMTSAYKRALADYQNLLKRTDVEKREFVQFAVKNFLERLLSVVDDFFMANVHLKDKGLELALKKFGKLLDNEGVTRIETIGKEYDINTMEAIQIVEGKEDNKVVAEHRAGYMMHGSVLRPAQVSVSKKK